MSTAPVSDGRVNLIAADLVNGCQKNVFLYRLCGVLSVRRHRKEFVNVSVSANDCVIVDTNDERWG